MSSHDASLRTAARTAFVVVAAALGPGCPYSCFDVYVGVPAPLPTEPVDGGVVVDDGIVRGDFDLARDGPEAFANAREIEGDLVFRTDLAASFANSGLTRIGGDLLLIGNPNLTSVVFSGLTLVGGDVIVLANPALQALSFTALANVGRDVVLAECPALNFTSFPAVTTVGGGIDWGAGASPRLDALNAIAGDLVVNVVDDGAPDLVTFSAPLLATIQGDLRAYDNGTLITLALPALTTVEGVIDVRNNADLVMLDLTALVALGGTLCICDNAALDACVAESVVDALVAQGWSENAVTTGNLGTCE
jgi:hypothetical protein